MISPRFVQLASDPPSPDPGLQILHSSVVTGAVLHSAASSVGAMIVAASLTWRIPWTEEPGGLMVHWVAKSWTPLRTTPCIVQKRPQVTLTAQQVPVTL